MPTKILFAEDTVDLNRAVTVVLQHEGFEVDSYTNGDTAAEALANSVYDLVILDIMMPGRSGLEVLRGMLSGKSSKKGLAEAAGDMTVAEEAASWVIPVLTLLLLASAPLFIAIERGNPVFPVTVMTLWALYLQNEEEAWKKELALILIAAAAGFKIYPAIFGLLYIKEKRFPETVPCATKEF